MTYQLILGNRTYSPWSLRVWMLFQAFDIDFHHIVIPLYTEHFDHYRERHYPAKAVPSLVLGHDGADITIWDSLAITEFVNEQHPDLGIWPGDPVRRAVARTLCAEMHSGFTALRSTMPMNLKRVYTDFTPDSTVQADIDRITGLWTWARSRWGTDGPYLFGAVFTAADAFFTPVAERFRTYSVPIDGPAKDYMSSLITHPAAIEFRAAAQGEPWVMAHNEFEDGPVR